MVGFISAFPVNQIIYNKDVLIIEINFLSVKLNYTSRRLATVLIKDN